MKKLLKEDITKEEFAEKLQRIVRYYYWCKAEWEVVITSWAPHIDKKELDRLNTEYEEHYKKWGKYPYSLCVELDVGKKVDIYSQVELNWDLFVDYIWGYKEKEK